MEQACALDTKKSNTLWTDAISKEMENVRVAFDVFPDGQSIPIVHNFVQYTVIDINMDYFWWKARLVAGGHMTVAPATITYTSRVLREMVWIALMIVALNDLELKLKEILDNDVQATVTENVWTSLGNKFMLERLQ